MNKPIEKDIGFVDSNTNQPKLNNGKIISIAVFENPLVKNKISYFFCTRKDNGAACLEITGYEITAEIVDRIVKANNIQGAAEIAKENKESESLFIPWHRVIRIKNIMLNIK